MMMRAYGLKPCQLSAAEVVNSGTLMALRRFTANTGTLRKPSFSYSAIALRLSCSTDRSM